MKLKLIALLTLLLQCGCLYAVDPTLRARPRYTLQPGDSMELALRFSPEYDQTVSVQPDGYVSVNLIGEVKVGGLTLDQAHDLIVNDLSARLNHPELNLVLKDFQHAYVVVGGEVASPGKFDYRQNMTAMQAVLLAGGFRGSARDTRIVVFRHLSGDMGEVKVVNLHAMYKTKNLERDITLEPGDMIMVPANRVATFSRYMDATHFSSAVSSSAVP